MGPHKWVLKVNGAPLGDLFAAYIDQLQFACLVLTGYVYISARKLLHAGLMQVIVSNPSNSKFCFRRLKITKSYSLHFIPKRIVGRVLLVLSIVCELDPNYISCKLIN
jgi:putative cell wall-binding protein